MKNNYNVLLINPPSKGSYRSKIMLGDCLGLNAVSGKLLDLGCVVKVMDCFLRDYTINDILAELNNNDQITIVGISVMWTDSVNYVCEIIKEILNVRDDLFLFIGGYAATVAPKQMLNLPVNIVISGDNLDCLHNVLREFDNWYISGDKSHIARKIKSPIDYNEYDYGSINRPDLVESYNKDKIVSLESSKGCYGRCAFCTIFYQYKSHWIPRNIDNVLAEMRYIREKCDCSVLRFVDANFLGGRKHCWNRYITLSKEAHRLNFKFIIECRVSDISSKQLFLLKELGLVGVFLGIENATQQILDVLHKDINYDQILYAVNTLKKHRVCYSYGFMMVTPYTTEEMIYKNIDLLHEIEYGVRWKHMFSALIIKKKNIFKVQPPIYSFEENYGYSCNNELCRKILWAYDISLRRHLKALEMENYIGICIERGKQAMDEYYWDIDKEFSAICIDYFERLLENLKKIHLNYLEVEEAIDCCMSILYSELMKIKKKIVSHGIPLETKITTFDDFFVE